MHKEIITPDANAAIGQRCRAYRARHNISLEKLAEILPRQITHQMLAKYETGQSRWPADLISEVATALNVDIRYLLGLEKDTQTEAEIEAEGVKQQFLKMEVRKRRIIYQVIHIIAHGPIYKD